MFTPEEIISQYIAGKDTNRPALFNNCFSEEATLRIVSSTDAVTLPGLARGRLDIARVVARDFARTYENVFTFCVGAKPASHLQAFSCPWVVAMTVKDDLTGRVGWGEYQWQFDSMQDGLCSALSIRIDQMLVLTPDDTEPLMKWVTALPYPWCDISDFPAITRIEALAATMKPFVEWANQLPANRRSTQT